MYDGKYLIDELSIQNVTPKFSTMTRNDNCKSIFPCLESSNLWIAAIHLLLCAVAFRSL